MKNYYQILGLEESASKEEVKKAYKQLSFKYHPDKHNGNDLYDELFKNINEANQVLSSDVKRVEYDFLLQENSRLAKKWQQSFSRQEEVFQGKQSVRKKVLVKVAWVAAGLVFVSVITFFLVQYNANSSSETAMETEIIALKPSKEVVLPFGNEMEPVKNKLVRTKDVEKKLLPTSDENDFSAGLVSNFEKQRELNTKKTEAALKKQALPGSIAFEKAQLEKTFTEEQMETVFEEISRKKTELGNTANCVRILQTNSSNVKNGFDIATFLRRKGFIISGRETIKDELKGINIDAANSCIVVKIGIL